MKNRGSEGRRANDAPRSLWIAGIVLAAVGVIVFAVQMVGQSMAGSSQYPWGFYIAMFYTLASAGAGLLVAGGIACVGGFVDRDLMARLYVIACALFVSASILIAVDLGVPQAIMLTYASANPASPVFFDAIALPLCIVFTIAAALLVRERVAMLPVAVVGIVAGLALLAVEAWLLATCSGKDAWGVLLGAGPALIQACTIAVAVIAAISPRNRAWCVLLAAGALVTASSLVFDVALNAGAGTVLARQFFAISLQPLFWVAAVCSLAAAITAFAAPSVGALAARVAAALAVIAVPLFKLAVFWGTQSVAAVSELGTPDAPSFNPIELAVFAGVVGIGMIAYAAGVQVLARRAARVSADSDSQSAKSVLTEEVHA